jgi:modulator of FtsH protease HflC
MKRNPFTLAIGSLLVILFGLLLVLFQVRYTEVAVVTTFGKPTRPIIEPGRHWKWPWPIQQVYKFDQRVQNFEDPLTEGLTQDGFNLLTSVYVGWQITNPASFFPKFAGSTDRIGEAEKGIERLLGNIKSGIVGKHPLSDFVSASDKGTNFLAVENEILAALQSQVSAQNYGLDIKFLGIKKLEFPESVTATVFEKMQSERKVLADGLQNDGERQAQNIRSDADRKAAELLADADLRARQIEGQGVAEAAKSMAVFKRDPVLATFLFRLDALEASLKEKSTLIFDQHTPPFDLFMYGAVSTNLLYK